MFQKKRSQTLHSLLTGSAHMQGSRYCYSYIFHLTNKSIRQQHNPWMLNFLFVTGTNMLRFVIRWLNLFLKAFCSHRVDEALETYVNHTLNNKTNQKHTITLERCTTVSITTHNTGREFVQRFYHSFILPN